MSSKEQFEDKDASTLERSPWQPPEIPIPGISDDALKVYHKANRNLREATENFWKLCARYDRNMSFAALQKLKADFIALDKEWFEVWPVAIGGMYDIARHKPASKGALQAYAELLENSRLAQAAAASIAMNT